MIFSDVSDFIDAGESAVPFFAYTQELLFSFDRDSFDDFIEPPFLKVDFIRFHDNFFTTVSQTENWFQFSPNALTLARSVVLLGVG